MDLQELEALVRGAELGEMAAKVDLKAEFRLDVGDAAYKERKRSELAWDVAALANTRGGAGHLIIGIDENTRQPIEGGVVGITPDQIQQILTVRCSPPVHVEIDIVRWSTSEPVLVIIVPRSDRKPHVVRERGCPVRRGATTNHASQHELLEMVQDTGGLDFGRTLVRTATLADLDLDAVAGYLTDQGQTPLDPSRPSEGALAGHGLTRRDDNQSYPTAGAILLLGRVPQTHLPQATLALVRFPDDRASDPQDSLVADGTILQQIESAERFLIRNLADDYPTEVFREAVVNALMHRDYAIGWAEVSVRIQRDIIEVASPGLLIGGLQVADLNRGPIDHPPRRNPSLVNIFFAQTRSLRAAGSLYLERAGSGINRMRERLAERGLPPPELREDTQHGFFVVTLRQVPLGRASRPSDVRSTELNRRQRELLAQLRSGDLISAREYQERFAVSRATARADLMALVRVGLLSPSGSGRWVRYRSFF